MVMTKTRRRKPKVETKGPDVAQFFKTHLGYKQSTVSFYTTANRLCEGCGVIKPGVEFDVPVTPGRPDLNKCRRCN